MTWKRKVSRQFAHSARFCYACTTTAHSSAFLWHSRFSLLGAALTDVQRPGSLEVTWDFLGRGLNSFLPNKGPKESGCRVAERSLTVVSGSLDDLVAVLVVMVIRRVGYLTHFAIMYWDYERTSVPVGYTLQSNSSVLVKLKSMNLTLALSEDSSAEFEELFLESFPTTCIIPGKSRRPKRFRLVIASASCCMVG